MFPKYLLLSLWLAFGVCQAQVGKMVCYYESSSFLRTGTAQLTLHDLEPALNFCNYLVYGYAGIDVETYTLKALNENLDIKQNHYRTIAGLKQKYPQLRVLLSVGGDRDNAVDVTEDTTVENNKYLKLLEDEKSRLDFKYSVQATLSTYGFDGIDLAWQFPKDKPIEVKSGLKKAWSKFKNWFSSGAVLDQKAEEHKAQFAMLVRELHTELALRGQVLSLTMLPHVNAELFIDVPAVVREVDFVNLGTYDFHTPARDPKVADLSAPLYAMYERDARHNVDYHVEYWLNHTAPANKLNVGVTSYGRSWVMSRDSGITGYPPIPDTTGAANGSHTPGWLSWPEICALSHGMKDLCCEAATLRKVGDPTKRFGIYAYRAADDNGDYGLWVSYEDPTSVAIKAGYVRAKNLGGVALFDLSHDDYHGQCAGEKYPILRSIKYKL